jgi:hypothetical protein
MKSSILPRFTGEAVTMRLLVALSDSMRKESVETPSTAFRLALRVVFRSSEAAYWHWMTFEVFASRRASPDDRLELGDLALEVGDDERVGARVDLHRPMSGETLRWSIALIFSASECWSTMSLVTTRSAAVIRQTASMSPFIWAIASGVSLMMSELVFLSTMIDPAAVFTPPAIWLTSWALVEPSFTTSVSVRSLPDWRISTKPPFACQWRPLLRQTGSSTARTRYP